MLRQGENKRHSWPKKALTGVALGTKNRHLLEYIVLFNLLNNNADFDS